MDVAHDTTDATVEVSAPQSLIDVDPPEVKPAPAADDQKAPEAGSEEQKPDTPEQKEAKELSRRARANARKAAELAEARTEARMLREQLESLTKRVEPQSGEPKREQFDDYESYLRAVTKYDAEQVADARLKVEREASQGKETQSKAAESQAKVAEAWQMLESAFEKATPDYQSVVEPFVEEDLGQLSNPARMAIVESENGPALLYKLAQDDTGLIDKIAKLSPAKQVMELGKLEAALESAPKPKAKTVSDAPAPIAPVKGGRSAGSGYSENMTDAEYKAWRSQQGARWAR